MLIEVLKSIEDHRDPQGREYHLWHILLFSVLAVLSGALGYTDIERFMTMHFATLQRLFGLKWRRVPHFSAIRRIILGTDPERLREAFAQFAAALYQASEKGQSHLCVDGKALNNAFSFTKDRKAPSIFQVFAAQSRIILSTRPISGKESEIPALYAFLEDLDLPGVYVTADALHCQKKTSPSPKRKK